MNPKDFDPGPLAQVECRREGDRWTLLFTRRLRHPPAKVWGALTNAAQLCEWAPFQPDRDLGEPGPATLSMTDGHQVEQFPPTVRVAIANQRLEYTWGDDVLRWDLEADGDGTRLTLSHTTESPDWVPRTAAGWHICLIVAERLLDGEPIGPIVGNEAKKYGWEALNQAYAAKLGLTAKGWPEVFKDS